MTADPVMVALPGTMCSPAVFEPLARALAGDVAVDPFSWLTEPGPWDIPAIAERVADHIDTRWGRPVLVCGHSTGGAIALQLAIRRPSAPGSSTGPRGSASRRSMTPSPASATST